MRKLKITPEQLTNEAKFTTAILQLEKKIGEPIKKVVLRKMYLYPKPPHNHSTDN